MDISPIDSHHQRFTRLRERFPLCGTSFNKGKLLVAQFTIHPSCHRLHMPKEGCCTDQFLQRQDLREQFNCAPVAHDGCPLGLQIGKLWCCSLRKTFCERTRTELFLSLSLRFCLVT